MVQNKALVFSAVPDGMPKPGKDLTVEDRGFDLEAAPPKDGIVVKNIYNSFDPYLRGRLREPNTKSYLPAFTLGEPIQSHTLFKVLKSDNKNWKEGEYGVGVLPIAEYNALDGNTVGSPRGVFGLNHINNKHNIDLSYYIGAVGMPGLTAYASFYDIGKPKKGETIWISAASGAVGQLVGALAKHEGLKVIGSVGSDDKLDFIKSLGFDGFNYKKEKPHDALQRLAPDGIDVFYDNVGGEQLEVAIDHLNVFGRIVACGQISQYNLKPNEKYGVKNLEQFFGKQLAMRGFLVATYDIKWYDELIEKVSEWIGKGEMKPVQAFTKGIDNAPQGLVDMLSGKNMGKSTLVLSEL